MQKNKLRVGLLVDGMELAAWQRRMIEIIRESNYADISLVIQNTLPVEHGPSTFRGKVVAKLSSGQLWTTIFRRLLAFLERHLVNRAALLPDASKRIDCTLLLADCHLIKVHPRRQNFSDYIEGDELASIQTQSIDVFVRLGFRILRGGILQCARYGIWSYHHGDNIVNRGGPPAYWEVMESWPETGSVLQIITEDLDNGMILYRSYSSTHDTSLKDNASNLYWKTLHFIPRKLNELYSIGGDLFLSRHKHANIHPQLYDRRLFKAPTNLEQAGLIWRKFLQKLGRKLDDTIYFNQWFLLYDIRAAMSTSLWRFKRITPPKDRFWADPFIVARNDKYYIFIEELLYATQKGHISVVVMEKNGTYAPPSRVLETPYHLSYPFIFEFENTTYMIPESAANRTVELYKCTAFPDKWEFQKNLMENCSLVDATAFQWRDKWWLFANQAETEGASRWEELFLYYSDSPLSDNWTPHPKNPVVSDSRSARPAGRLFVRNERIYRPSQNCSRHYGYGFNICEVTKLTETEYEEQVVSTVEPKWSEEIVSTHTFNYEDGLTIIDGQLRRKRW